VPSTAAWPATDVLRGLTRTAFAQAAGAIMGDVNDVHPFREGNGRTQLYFLEQLAA
jgi:cell filamentation protein